MDILLFLMEKLKNINNMHFTLNGKNYLVKFQYETTSVGISTSAKIIKVPFEENSIPVGIGVAYCSLNDQFNKNTGRKLALARAISPLPRLLRAVIWEAYDAQIGLCKVTRRKRNQEQSEIITW